MCLKYNCILGRKWSCVTLYDEVKNDPNTYVWRESIGEERCQCHGDEMRETGFSRLALSADVAWVARVALKGFWIISRCLV